MYYALNLFDVDSYERYREYLDQAGPVVREVGGEVIVVARKLPEVPVTFPGTTEGGKQEWLIIASYPDEDAVKRYWNHPSTEKFRDIREEATSNYVWAMYKQSDGGVVQA